VSVPVQVAADGTFQGGTDYGMYEPMFRRDYRVGHMTVDGRITGGTLEMVESDYRCARRSVLNRR
jgi:hypothetical protein